MPNKICVCPLPFDPWIEADFHLAVDPFGRGHFEVREDFFCDREDEAQNMPLGAFSHREDILFEMLAAPIFKRRFVVH